MKAQYRAVANKRESDHSGMSTLSNRIPSLMVNAHALMETMIIAGIVTLATVGFLAGLKELATDLRNLRKAKI